MSRKKKQKKHIACYKTQDFTYRGTANVEHETVIMPIVSEATGIVPEILKKNVEAIPRKH